MIGEKRKNVMDLFSPILNQMVFLLLFIVLGVILAKAKQVPENSARVLSRLENLVFVPALVLDTFITNCNVATLKSVWPLLVCCAAVLVVAIPVSILLAKICFKENYLRKVATYGLAFSNFGFMGNAIMQAVFGDIFFEYTVFCLPLWFMIYLWGAPVLLISGSDEKGEKVSLKNRLKAFLNPMLISMFVGLILGLLEVKFPVGVSGAIKAAGACMSPVAMLLTGLTVGQMDILKLLSRWRIYLTCAVKLVFYPLLFLGIFALLALLPQNDFITPTFFKCAMCFATMPIGMNTIVIPAAYGKDTSDAAGLALVSHIGSVITIPLAFMALSAWIL